MGGEEIQCNCMIMTFDDTDSYSEQVTLYMGPGHGRERNETLED